MKIRDSVFACFLTLVSLGLACSSNVPSGVNNSSNSTPVQPQTNVSTPSPTPSSGSNNSNSVKAEGSPSGSVTTGFTEDDLQKIKWLEGTWKGTYKSSEFYERITFKGSKVLIETFTDGTLKKKGPDASFELKKGELLHATEERRWKASAISEDSVQFIPADPPKPGENASASFRFERQSGNTWRAILETPETATRPPLTKVYKMEPWSAEMPK